MPDTQGYDVQIAGANYKLMRDANRIPQLRFLDAPDEPGNRGGVGTIVFDELHHGIGPTFSPNGDVYQRSSFFSAMRPGRIESFGAESIGDLLIGGVADTGPVAREVLNSFIYATSFQTPLGVFFVMPNKIIKFAGGALTGTVVHTTTDNMRGPAAFYRGKWFIGLETNAGVSSGHVEYDASADIWTTENGGTDAKGSLFFSVHTWLWCLEQVATAATIDGSVTWKIKYTDTDDATPESSFIDVTVEKNEPQPNAIYPLGRWLLVFGHHGEIVAVSEGDMRALVPAGSLSLADRSFGVGARMWGEQLVVPGARGLIALSLSGAALRDISPINIQTGLGQSAMEPSCVTPYGPDLLVGTKNRVADASGSAPFVLVMRKYPEGTFYNELHDFSLGNWDGSSVMRAMESLANGRTYMLSGNTTAGRVRLLDLPPPYGGAPLSQQSGTIQLSQTYGPSPGRKIFLQVRGWLESALSGADKLRILANVDNAGDAALIDNVQAAGPFVGSENQPIGRALGLKIDSVLSGATFPVVEASATSFDNTIDGSSVVDLPSGIVSGNLLLVFFFAPDDVTFPAGWTELNTGVNDLSCAYRKATGSEGASITVTINGNEASAHVAMRISGMADPAVTAPVVAGFADGVDPPNLVPVGGPKPYLWIAVAGAESGEITAAPGGYSSFARANGSHDCATAIRNLFASSENPVPFTGPASNSKALTVAVYPAVSPSWPVVLLPLFVDYIEEPEAGRRIEIEVDARGGYVRGGMATTDRLGIFNTLKALQGTNVTLELLESSTSYTVHVEQVEAADRAPATGRERPASIISVVMRVL